jgi:hypothetical protein
LFLGFELAELDCLFDEGVVEIEHRDDGTPPNANTSILRSEFAGGKRWFLRYCHAGASFAGAAAIHCLVRDFRVS